MCQLTNSLPASFPTSALRPSGNQAHTPILPQCPAAYQRVPLRAGNRWTGHLNSGQQVMYMRSTPHPRAGHLLQLVNPHQHSIITQDPSFTSGFTLSVYVLCVWTSTIRVPHGGVSMALEVPCSACSCLPPPNPGHY